MAGVTSLDLDFNKIQLIYPNALSMLNNLEILSLSYNDLTELIKNNFVNQFKLKYLNLSHNRIYSIEADSFRNLLNLEVLDLSFNILKSIENNIWHGLRSLNDLHLLAAFEINLTNESLNFLPQLNNLYINESLIIKYKCSFMHSVQPVIQRNVSNGKIVFLKSLNLISPENAHDLVNFCELTLEFLQFRIHFNLKIDFENEVFYLRCKESLSEKTNKFIRNYKKCFPDFKLYDEISANVSILSSFVKLISGLWFWITVISFLAFLVPSFYIICTELNFF